MGNSKDKVCLENSCWRFKSWSSFPPETFRKLCFSCLGEKIANNSFPTVDKKRRITTKSEQSHNCIPKTGWNFSYCVSLICGECPGDKRYKMKLGTKVWINAFGCNKSAPKHKMTESFCVLSAKKNTNLMWNNKSSGGIFGLLSENKYVSTLLNRQNFNVVNILPERIANFFCRTKHAL